MNLVDFEAGISLEPAILKYQCETLGDSPARHRWRASWAVDFETTVGIMLTAYPVIKTTPQGVWIDHMSWRDRGEFRLSGRKKIVMNGSGSAWAKPTQDEAIKSLAIRLARWSQHIRSDRHRAISAAKVMAILRPASAEMANAAAEYLK